MVIIGALGPLSAAIPSRLADNAFGRQDLEAARLVGGADAVGHRHKRPVPIQARKRAAARRGRRPAIARRRPDRPSAPDLERAAERRNVDAKAPVPDERRAGRRRRRRAGRRGPIRGARDSVPSRRFDDDAVERPLERCRRRRRCRIASRSASMPASGGV